MNIFDMQGPEFLSFYLFVLAGAIAVGLGLRFVLKWVVRTDASEPAWPLDGYDVAMLAGGQRTALNAAFAALVQRSVAMLSRSSRKLANSRSSASRKLARSHGGPDSLHAVEHEVLARLDPEGTSIQGLYGQRYESLQTIRLRLERAGLVFSPAGVFAITIASIMPLLALAGVGVMKVTVGVARDRPIGLLIVLIVVTLFAAYLLGRWKVIRTPQGDQMLHSLRDQHAALRYTTMTNASHLVGDELPTAVGLYGTDFLSHESFCGLNRALPLPLIPIAWGTWTSGGDSCSSSCGSSCGGGGCGGCGGD